MTRTCCVPLTPPDLDGPIACLAICRGDAEKKAKMHREYRVWHYVQSSNKTVPPRGADRCLILSHHRALVQPACFRLSRSHQFQEIHAHTQVMEPNSYPNLPRSCVSPSKIVPLPPPHPHSPHTIQTPPHYTTNKNAFRELSKTRHRFTHGPVSHPGAPAPRATDAKASSGTPSIHTDVQGERPTSSLGGMHNAPFNEQLSIPPTPSSRKILCPVTCPSGGVQRLRRHHVEVDHPDSREDHLGQLFLGVTLAAGHRFTNRRVGQAFNGSCIEDR